jgi:hypothetical protein
MLEELAKEIGKHGGRYYIKNFWSERGPLLLGYVGIHVKIRMPLPTKPNQYILMEVQVHPKQIMDGTKDCAKEIAHRLYKMPGEASEEKVSPDLVSSSQLVYLTSMTKLLCPKEELDRVADFVDLIEGATGTADKKRLLVAETALLLHNEKQLGSGDWNEKLQAVVPRNKEAVEKAWLDTATNINNDLKLPVVKRDEQYPWTNTATTVDELYADAAEVQRLFKTMCKNAALSQRWCYVNFGPRNKHMIKEEKSLRDKIAKDMGSFSAPSGPGPSPSPQGSTKPPSPKDDYVTLLHALLNNDLVTKIPSLARILRKQFSELAGPKIQALTPKQEESHWWAQKLLINQKVSIDASDQLHKLHLAFGATDWAEYFGDVGAEPPLPPNMTKIFSAPCPFWPGKSIDETHLFVLVPHVVNGQPLTLQSLGELVKKPLQGHASQYHGLSLGEYVDPPASGSHWVLVTRNVIEGSRAKSHKDQQAVLVGYSKKSNMLYVVPKILDMTVAIFMEHVRSGTKLYGDSLFTYTRCQEKYNKNLQLVVGGFSASGLCVGIGHYGVEDDGVGGSLEVFGT